MINILVVDHHPIFRLGLKHLLSQVSEYNVVAEAGNGADAVDLAKKLSPDLIILDMQLSKLDGIKATRQIVGHNIHAKIIALSNFTMEDQVIDMINAGVKGLLFKSDDNDQILTAVQQVLKNEEYFCKGAVEILVNRFARGNPEVRTLINTSVFSKRELDIINLYGAKVIAITLNTRGLSLEEARRYQQEYEKEYNIPVVLPIEEGMDKLIDAVNIYTEKFSQIPAKA